MGVKAPIQYVLIDFENVQPKNLSLLQQHQFRVLVFVGAAQHRIPFELASAMQALGDAGQYIKINGSGKNALDFHIACYMGEMAVQEPAACFHIISKDTGFDPLIKHLNGRRIKAYRHKDLAEIPILQLSNATTSNEKIEAIVKNLQGQGTSRPRKVATLSNTINSWFKENIPGEELKVLVEGLEQQHYIVVKAGNVSYTLPRATK